MTGAVESERRELTPANTACHSGGLLAVTLGATWTATSTSRRLLTTVLVTICISLQTFNLITF